MRTLRPMVLSIALLMLCQGGSAFAQAARVAVDIKPQPMRAALKELGAQAGLQILFRAQDVARDGEWSPAVSGELSAQEALDRLLANTGLSYEFINVRTVRIAPASEGATNNAARADATRVANGASTSDIGLTPASEQTKPASSSADTPAQSDSVSEIVVTAQKRAERLQDVPVPVTAIKAQALVDAGQLRIQDFYTRVPGLIVSPTRQQNFLAIRGITSGGPTNPTVGVTVDDMPYGSSTNLGGGAFVPDFDPGELAQVEVLRGPQGTLYGTSSMGGLVKFVTADPSTERLSGRVSAGVSTVRNGDEPGYNARGSINVPIGETFAVRASAFHRRDAGYIDNVRTGERAVNSVDATGGHFSALYRPSERFSLKLSALVQQLEDEGSYDVDRLPGLKDLQQSRLPNTGRNERKAQAYSALLTADLGAAQLTSITGYNVTNEEDAFDFGFQFGPQMLARFGVPTAVLINRIETRKVSEEARLVIPIGSRVEWLVGGFYTDEDAQLNQAIWPADPVAGTKLADWSNGVFPTRYKEYAALTNVTLRFTERFDVQVGGRQSRITTSSERQVQTGPRFQNGLVIAPPIDSRADVFTYLLTPRFKLSPDVMVYARAASGYRAGGPNGGAQVALGLVPPSYGPDKTRNYEAGIKGDFLHDTLTLDASIYSIDWQDIQLTVQNVQTSQFYTSNASRARSRGVEVAVELRPLDGMTVAGWVARSDAALREAFPSDATVYGVVGSLLPFTPKWSGHIAVTQEFPMTSALTGFVGASWAYVGDRTGLFRGRAAGVPLPRQPYASYNRLDLQAGVRMASWSANLYLNNLTDKQGVLNGGAGTQPPFGFQYIQPRTAGVSITRNF